MRPRALRRLGTAVVEGAEPAIEGQLGRAVVTLEIAVVELVKEIPRPRGFRFARHDLLKTRMAHRRADLLKHGVEHHVERMGRDDQMDEIG